MWIIFRNSDDRWLGKDSWLTDIAGARRVSDNEAATILLLCPDTAAFLAGAGSLIPPAGEGQKIMEKLVQHAMSVAA